MKCYAPGLIVLAGILWGTMGLFVRKFNAMGLESMEIVELRCYIAAVILFIGTFLRDKKLLKVKGKNLPVLICSGIFSIVFFYYCYFSTISIMNLSAAAILLYTAPIFVMLMSVVLFREKLTVKKVLVLVMAFSGCCLVSGVATASQALSWKGILLGLGSGFGYALYSIFSRFGLNQGLHSVTITNYTFLFAAVGGAFLADFSALGTAFSEYGVSFVLFSVFYTLITTVLPYLLYTLGLSYVENGTASIMASVEPVVATLLGIIVFSEKPTVSSVIGIVLVLIALVLLNLEKKN